MRRNKSTVQFWGMLAFVITFSVPAAHCLSPGATPAAADKMSDEDAAKLLNSHEMFRSVQTIKLITGIIPASVSEIAHYQPQYTAFKSMGLIELTSVKTDSPDKDANRSAEGTRVSLTEKGLQESKAWTQGGQNEWTIVIAVRKLVEVIKIHQQSERIQGIEFSWTWAPNATGEALKRSYETEKAYAKLEPHENGWRIVTIRAIGSGGVIARCSPGSLNQNKNA